MTINFLSVTENIQTQVNKKFPAVAEIADRTALEMLDSHEEFEVSVSV